MRDFKIVFLLITAVMLCSCSNKQTFDPMEAATETGVDITVLPDLGTPATATDSLVTYDSSAAAESRITEIKFDADVTHFMSGTGAWVDALTSAEFDFLDGINQSLDTAEDVTFNSVSIAKTTGVAGRMGVFEANSTDTFKKGWEGPASIAQDTYYKFHNDDPDNELMLFAAPSSGVSQQSWLDLGSMTLDVATNGDINGHKTVIVSATDVAGGTLNSYSGGTEVVMTASGEVNMPDCWSSNVGLEIEVWNKTNTNQVELVMYGDASDAFILHNGTILDANDEADMATTAWSHVKLHCFQEDYWYIEDINGTTTDGGVPD